MNWMPRKQTRDQARAAGNCSALATADTVLADGPADVGDEVLAPSYGSKVAHGWLYRGSFSKAHSSRAISEAGTDIPAEEEEAGSGNDAGSLTVQAEANASTPSWPDHEQRQCQSSEPRIHGRPHHASITISSSFFRWI